MTNPLFAKDTDSHTPHSIDETTHGRGMYNYVLFTVALAVMASATIFIANVSGVNPYLLFFLLATMWIWTIKEKNHA